VLSPFLNRINYSQGWTRSCLYQQLLSFRYSSTDKTPTTITLKDTLSSPSNAVQGIKALFQKSTEAAKQVFVGSKILFERGKEIRKLRITLHEQQRSPTRTEFLLVSKKGFSFSSSPLFKGLNV